MDAERNSVGKPASKVVRNRFFKSPNESTVLNYATVGNFAALNSLAVKNGQHVS